MGAKGSASSKPLDQLEALLGHTFRVQRNLELALTHSSLAHEQATSGAEAFSVVHKGSTYETERDNEQLEFLGDAVLGLVAAESLLRAYPDLDEGNLSRIRHQLISRKHLGGVGSRLSLGSFLRLGLGEERSGGRQKPVLLANAIEAVIAALYLDGGLKPAAQFIERWIIQPYVEELRAELDAGESMGDHKSALQEWLQAHKAGSPHYTVKAESGPDHRKRFLVEVEIATETGEAVVAQGHGSTKKKAEQEAARKAYQTIRHESGMADAVGAAKGTSAGKDTARVKVS